ncbi:YdcF family protein [Tsukamurella sp. 8F]|uniref:SanA/YdcF family protein n=1 Tax=unclassified Tsukamurella TaxID=2633480 RepID=UPI0023B8F020|nr:MULTISPECIES: YdcF family protein [unclassified Tsukamurella]MDF0528521.1 YdcF family protein [Tsukamurella sp. 8J]MDF0586347.1 YdcF family protein [Tsukamurella sp. 8F]
MWIASSVARGLRGDGPLYGPDDAPPAPVAIVFGASVKGGRPGSFVEGRLEAALALYEAGRVQRILVSGNAGGTSGDEIEVMTGWLRSRGVPASALLTDGVGLDTFLTCRHAREDFGLTRVLVVSQGFHARRAVALGRHLGLDVDGVRAPCDCTRRAWVRNRAREYLLSRPKAALDMARHR